MKLRSKSLTAITAAVALLVLSSAPASATVVSFEATDGTVGTTIGSFDLGGGGGGGGGGSNPPPCGGSTGVFEVDETPAAGGGWDTLITNVNITTSIVAGTPPVPWIVEITKHTGANDGFIAAAGPPHDITQNASFRVDVYATTGTAPDCVKAAKRCTLRATLAGLAGETPDTPTHATGDVIEDLTGSGLVQTIPFQTCNAPFAAMVNSTASLTAVELTAD